jgi:hypothetical protein
MLASSQNCSAKLKGLKFIHYFGMDMNHHPFGGTSIFFKPKSKACKTTLEHLIAILPIQPIWAFSNIDQIQHTLLIISQLQPINI